MRVAALYDIHGMLPALEAVLAEVEREDVDAIVLGGDLVGGPQPAETLARLRALGERVALDPRQRRAELAGDGGARAGDAGRAGVRRGRLPPTTASSCGAPGALTLELDGSAASSSATRRRATTTSVTPRSRRTSARRERRRGRRSGRRRRGHTHMQYDRTVGGTRWVNAGSVGMPFEGEVGRVLGAPRAGRRAPAHAVRRRPRGRDRRVRLAGRRAFAARTSAAVARRGDRRTSSARSSGGVTTASSSAASASRTALQGAFFVERRERGAASASPRARSSSSAASPRASSSRSSRAAGP